MQQLIINGSPTRLKKVVEFLEQMELQELNPNFTPGYLAPVTGNGSSSAGPTQTAGPAQTSETSEAEKTGRTRRTKEQIAADNAKLAPVQVTQADIKANLKPEPAADERKDGITMDQLKVFTKEKAQTHGPAIREKLKEFGAERAGELKPEHWNAYYVFLQGL